MRTSAAPHAVVRRVWRGICEPTSRDAGMRTTCSHGTRPRAPGWSTCRLGGRPTWGRNASSPARWPTPGAHGHGFRRAPAGRRATGRSRRGSAPQIAAARVISCGSQAWLSCAWRCRSPSRAAPRAAPPRRGGLVQGYLQGYNGGWDRSRSQWERGVWASPSSVRTRRAAGRHGCLCAPLKDKPGKRKWESRGCNRVRRSQRVSAGSPRP